MIDARTAGILSALDRPQTEHGRHLPVHLPGVAAGGLGVIEQLEDEHLAFP